MRNVFLYWVGKEYKVIKRLRRLIYMHSMFGTAYTVHLLDDKTVRNYIPDLPPSFSEMKPAHQADRIGAELLEVPVLFGATGDAPNFLQWCGVAAHGSSGYFSCCRSMGALVSGASG